MRKALIVDDHPFIRRIVRSVLEQLNFQVAAETDNGATALDLARTHLPHLMVLDLSMPKLDGLEVLKRLHILGLPIKVLVCSGLMKPDTHLGENARHIEVSDDQTTPCFFR